MPCYTIGAAVISVSATLFCNCNNIDWHSVSLPLQAENVKGGFKIREHTGAITSLGFSADDQLLFSASTDGDVRSWNMKTKASVVVLKGDDLLDATGLAISPDNGHVITTYLGGTIRLFDLKNNKERANLTNNTVLKCAVFSQNGQQFAVGVGGIICVWDMKTLDFLGKLVDHTQVITALAYGPDSKFLASGAGDSMIYVWDTTTFKRIAKCNYHKSLVSGILYFDKNTIISTSLDKGIMIWDPLKDQIVFEYKMKGASCLAFCRQKGLLAVGSLDKQVVLLSLADRKEIKTIATEFPVQSISLNSAGNWLAIGFGDLWARSTDKSNSGIVEVLAIKAPSNK
jgi:WD40 repeat protein